MPHSAALKHVEPECRDRFNGCTYLEPHHHGLECDDSCTECKGKCHPDCPVYSQAGRGNQAFETFLNGAVDGLVTIVVPIDEGETDGG